MFLPQVELQKALTAIQNDATGTSMSVMDAESIIMNTFKNDDSLDGGGFFVAYFKKPGIKIKGLGSQPFNGGTMLSTFCSPDRVKGHYKDVKYNKQAKMGVVIYSTPKHLEILSEQV